VTGDTTARRLGVFGGAFDPPHAAHVALARAAVEQLALDELRVFAMAKLAFADLSRTAVDERELHRPGPTYTIDTLRELKAGHPGAALFLVMGEDQADSLTRWHEWRAIVDSVVICVAARPLAQHGMAGTGLPAEAEVRLLQLPPMPESATEVRQRAAAGEGIDHLVPPGVASYIERHHLYRPT